MLATFTAPYIQPASHNAFLPVKPSPLSPRSANIYGRPRVSMSEQKDTNTNPVPFSKRPVKKAPSPKQDELKEKRRGMFLKKVRDGRDEKRFEARGEDIMRLDYIQRQKQWETEQEREAPQIPSDPIEEDDYEDAQELPTSSNAMQLSQPRSQRPWFEDEVDEVRQREEQEMEALLEHMPGQESEHGGEVQHEQNLWSDDDDYDALFSELMEQSELTEEQAKASSLTQEDGEAMDMS